MPSQIFLDISTLFSHRIGVFAASTIEEKTTIGPVSGRLVSSLNKEEAENAWEVKEQLY